VEKEIMLKKNALYVVGLFFVLSLVGANQTRAQTQNIESMVYSIGGWDLVRVNDTADQIMGFWGIPRVPVAVGNIRRLWFEALPNDDWSVWAFEPVAIHDRVVTLSIDGASPSSIAFLMFRESHAADTAINLDVDGGVQGLIDQGFISGDPLAGAAGSLANPKPMIDLLAAAGYPIAPGMTNLLVDGTTGAGVGMNPATKQTLNCWRSSSSSCLDCVCMRIEAPMVADPWVVYETPMPDGRLRCEFVRTEHHFYWKIGKDPDTCFDCTAGSAQNPIPEDGTVVVTEYWADQVNCNDAPSGY